MDKANIGLTSLAVMGQNLVLNMERNGYTVAVHNCTTKTMRDFVAAHPGKNLIGAETTQDFVGALTKPRKVMIMVKAGPPLDTVIQQLVPVLERRDLVHEQSQEEHRSNPDDLIENAAQGIAENPHRPTPRLSCRIPRRMPTWFSLFLSARCQHQLTCSPCTAS